MDKRGLLKEKGGHRVAEILLLALVLSSVFFLRLPRSAQLLINIDEASYLIIAQQTLQGSVVYRDIFDHKGPALYLLYMPPVYALGNDMVGARLWHTGLILATMVIVHLLCRPYLGGIRAVLPALGYGLFSTKGSALGIAMMSEAPMMLFVAAALLGLQEGGGKSLLFCGAASGIAALIRPNAAIFLAIVPLVLVGRRRRDREGLMGDMAWVLGGAIAAALPFLAYFAYHGALWDLFESYIIFNLGYVPTGGAEWKLIGLLSYIGKDIGAGGMAAAVLPLAFAGLLACLLPGGQRNLKLALLAFLILSLISTNSTGRMYRHYYMQMGLAFSLLIAYGIMRVPLSGKKMDVAAAVIVVAVLLAADPAASANRFGERMDSIDDGIPAKVAEYVSKNSGEEDSIFVHGWRADIYFLSGRRPGLRHMLDIYHEHEPTPPGLSGDTAYAMENAPPNIIVHQGKGFPRSLWPYRGMYELDARMGRFSIFRLKQDINNGEAHSSKSR